MASVWLVIILITGIALVIIAGVLLSIQYTRSGDQASSNLASFGLTAWALILMTVGIVVVLGYMGLLFLDEVIGLSEPMSMILGVGLSAVSVIPGLAVGSNFKKKRITQCELDPNCIL